MVARRYLSMAQVGALLGVGRSAVSKWRERHPPGTDHPFPAPDVEVGDAPGWAPERAEEIRAWRAGLPGRGAGGGRPRRQPEKSTGSGEFRA
jgi:predicted DNA-binding transcriptional regulator AlpA